LWYFLIMKTVLRVKNLTKRYGKFEAVKSVSFSVEKGEIFALIGPNGAGKSTTLKMISTILAPTNGEIEVMEYSRAKQPDKIREVISYLPEEAGAYKSLSGKDYLTLMSELYADNSEKKQKFLDKGVELSGLGDRLRDKIKTYSKGMTRKLLLARTMMVEPALAILDEPTSGLDVINALEIRRTIKEMAKNGLSVLLSSHNMLEIEFLSDRVAIIDKGVIHDTGTPEELKKKFHAKNLEEVFEAITNCKH